MVRITPAAVLALLAGIALGPPLRAEPSAPWTLGVHAGVLQVDDAAGNAEEGGEVRFTLGRQLDEEIRLELDAGAGTVDFREGQDLDMAHAALNVMLVNRAPTWNPYFLVGVGGFRDEGFGFTDTGALVQAAIGGQWDLNGYGLMLRADLRYRYLDRDVEVIDPGQPLVSIGLQFPFGRR